MRPRLVLTQCWCPAGDVCYEEIVNFCKRLDRIANDLTRPAHAASGLKRVIPSSAGVSVLSMPTDHRHIAFVHYHAPTLGQ